MVDTCIKIYLASRYIKITTVLLFISIFHNDTNATEITAPSNEDKKSLENLLLDNIINNIINKTIAAKDNILDDKFDASYIEHDKAINHHDYILSTVNCRQRQKRINIKKDQNIKYNNSTNIGESELWLLYSYNYNNNNKKLNTSYKQERDCNLCIGAEGNNKNLVAGCAYIRAQSNISTILNIKEKLMHKNTTLNKSYGLAYALYELNNVNNNCAFVYGKTKHFAASHKEFDSREYSMMVSSSYTLAWKKLEFDFGIAARLININTPEYKNGNIKVKSNKINYLSGAGVATINFNHNISSDIAIIADLNLCYLRNFIENNKRGISLDFNSKNFIIKQDFNMKQNWHFEIKLQALIYSLSVGIIANYNYYNKNKMLCGYSFFIGLNF